MDTHEEAPLGDLDTDERTGTDDERTGTDDDHTGDLDDEHTHDPRPIAVPTKQLGEFLINMVSVEPSLFKRKKEGGVGAEEDTNIYLPLNDLFVLHGNYATIVTSPNTTLNMEIVAFEAIMANAFVAGSGDFEQFKQKQVKCG